LRYLAKGSQFSQGLAWTVAGVNSLSIAQHFAIHYISLLPRYRADRIPASLVRPDNFLVTVVSDPDQIEHRRLSQAVTFAAEDSARNERVRFIARSPRCASATSNLARVIDF